MLDMLLCDIVDMSSIGDKPCKPPPNVGVTHNSQHMSAAPASAYYYHRYSVCHYRSCSRNDIFALKYGSIKVARV